MRGERFADDAQRVSGLDGEMVGGEKAGIAEMDFQDAGRRLENNQGAVRCGFRVCLKGNDGADKIGLTAHIVAAGVCGPDCGLLRERRGGKHDAGCGQQRDVATAHDSLFDENWFL